MSSTYTYTPAQGSLMFRYVLEPAYARMVNYLPRWLTPNAMTTIGILLTGSAAAVMMKSFHESTELSREVLILIAFLNLLYMTLDNLDGKQARRLNLSSAIGEYLDHGGDCWTSLLSTWCMFRLAGAPFPEYTIVILSIVTVLVHLYHLETGKTTLGGDFFSADEGMLTFAVVPLIHAFFPNVWSIVVIPETYIPEGTPEKCFSVVYICTAIFLLGQTAAIVDMFRSLGSKVFHSCVAQLLVTLLIMFLGYEDTIEWVVTTTMLSSSCIHIIIVASCLKKTGETTVNTALTASVLTGVPVVWMVAPHFWVFICLFFFSKKNI